MKLLLTILLWLVCFLILGQLFIWFLALVCVHDLLIVTQTAFLRNIIILIGSLVTIVFFEWKKPVTQKPPVKGFLHFQFLFNLNQLI